jgi:hypothetical protein
MAVQLEPVHRYNPGGELTNAVWPASADVHAGRLWTVALSMVTPNALPDVAAGCDVAASWLPQPEPTTATNPACAATIVATAIL